MTLAPGTRIGVYEIVAPLGAGGMGEVYRARDTNLGRDIAIKVLPEAMASDTERLARFDREARTLASLNHTNIAAIYGLERAGGTTALVMELVEGPTLADVIEKGHGLPLSDALPIARQIAEALEAAHEQGIVHRDLKPANVKVREDGTVKVLDFGLAKALSPESSDASRDAMLSPTLTARATQLGVILGTAAYMAPEQAKGKSVDRRADIWAFGVVLYEMLAGNRGYEAEDVSDTLAAVLMREVDWKALPRGLPPRLERLLRDCLVRDPKHRLRDIGEARRVLDQIISGTPDESIALTPASPTRLRMTTAAGWIVAALALTGAAILAVIHFREIPPTPQRVQFQVSNPENSPIVGFQLSPDGRYLAFTGAQINTSRVGEPQSRIWLRTMESLTVTALPGTDGVSPQSDQIFWSPDSAFIGFVAQGKLKRVSINGGPPQTLVAQVSTLTRGTWGRQGLILIVGGPGAPIQRVPDTGGMPVEVARVVGGESRFMPQFLPDGRHFLYYVVGVDAATNGIYVSSVDEGATPRRLLPDNTVARYTPPAAPGRSGHLLFVRDTALMAQPFDATTLALSGQVVPIAESVRRFSVSETGTLAYMSGALPSGRQELAWIDRSGKQIAVAGAPFEYRDFRLSPDEKRVVFTHISDEANTDIWVLDLDRGVPSRITFDPATDNLPIWSSDGARVLFPSRRKGAFDLYLKSATGAGQEELHIPMGTVNGWATDWSRDGRFVLYQRPGEKTGQDVWIAPQDSGSSAGEQKPFPYLQSPFNEGGGVISPDGRWIAYESDESGRAEVYVQAFPLTAEKDRVSTGGGANPSWSRAGTELFYMSATRDLMAVPYRTTATTFEPGVAKKLFAIPGATAPRRVFDVSADGRKFLIARPLSDISSEPVTVVLNWQAALGK